MSTKKIDYVNDFDSHMKIIDKQEMTCNQHHYKQSKTEHTATIKKSSYNLFLPIHVAIPCNYFFSVLQVHINQSIIYGFV